MYSKPMLSLEQTQKAMQAMIAKATQEPDRPVAIAIVDDAGNLLSYARMDNCRPNPQTFATRKAYTAALSGVDSAVYAERLKSQGRSVSDMGLLMSLEKRHHTCQFQNDSQIEISTRMISK